MSGHPASEHAPSQHDDHDAPPPGLDPDEPHTPYWLTALGGALFLSAAVFLLATAGEEPDAPDVEISAAAEAPEPPSEE